MAGKITLPQILRDNSSLITGTTILAANDPSRKDCIITLAAGGPYFVKRGADASATNWTWMLSVIGQTITIENYDGVITVDTDPSDDINVAIGRSNLSPQPNLPT